MLMLCSWLGFQAINDPQELARENDHLGGVIRVCRDVAVTLGIFVEADRAGKEIGHRFLFSDRQLGIRERAGRNGLAFLLGWPEGVAHQVRTVVIGPEFAAVTDGHLYLSKRFENGGVIFPAQKGRVHFGGDERVQLGLWATCSPCGRRRSPRAI